MNKKMLLFMLIMCSAKLAAGSEVLKVFQLPAYQEDRISSLMGLDVRPKSTVVWPLKFMNVDKVHSLPNGKGEGVKICLIDTGIDLLHPTLQGAVLEGRNFVPGESSANIYDLNTHGTWIAQLIVGRSTGDFVGVAPESQLIVAKVFGEDGTTQLSVILDAFKYCMDKSVDIINMSLSGSQDSDELSKLMKMARNSGVTVVASAGNTGDDLGFPARDSSVLAVGAVSEDSQVPKFSPQSTKLSYIAPGVKVPVLSTNLDYIYLSGTSFSSAYLSGIDALRRSAGAKSLQARSLSIPFYLQGQGVIDAYLTVKN